MAGGEEEEKEKEKEQPKIKKPVHGTIIREDTPFARRKRDNHNI